MIATLFHCLDLLRLSGSPADLQSSRLQLFSLLLLDVLVQASALAVLGWSQMFWIELLLARLAGIWVMLWLRGYPAR